MKPQVDDLVTVVIPAYNAGRFVGEAVASALAQTYPLIEVVVVDDGSTDDTAEVLKRFGEAIQVVRQDNRGLAAARNRAIAEASGEFVALLDADDRWDPSKVARQVERLRLDDRAILVHTGVSYMGPDGSPALWRQRFDPFTTYVGRCTVALLRHNGITASSVLLRRSALPAVAFRDGCFGCEDWDLWLRLAGVGEFECLQDPLTHYRLHVGMSNNQAIMRRSVVKVLEAFVEAPSFLSERQEALKQLKRARLDLANWEYEAGSLDEARLLFGRAGVSCSSTNSMRWLACYLPSAVRARLRHAKRRLAGMK
jgi:glycosyltransferase involved in cell wall biosynthesis